MPHHFVVADKVRMSWREPWTLIWTLMDPVACVSCVSSWYWVNAAETHETFRRESGMRYHPYHDIW